MSPIHIYSTHTVYTLSNIQISNDLDQHRGASFQMKTKGFLQFINFRFILETKLLFVLNLKKFSQSKRKQEIQVAVLQIRTETRN